MTAFKRYCKKKGLPSQEDYPWMPYDMGDNITLLDLEIDANTASVKMYLNIGTEVRSIQRDGSIEYDFV